MYFCVFVSMQIIVLEDTEVYISHHSKEVAEAQERKPFDLMVCPVETRVDY